MQSTLKRYKWRINACSMASKKIVRLVFVVRWKKGVKLVFTNRVGKC